MRSEGPRLLITDRNALVLLERARVHQLIDKAISAVDAALNAGEAVIGPSPNLRFRD